MQSDDGGLANVVLSNTNGYSCCVRAGQAVGVTQVVSLVEPASDDVQLPLDDPATDDPANVYVVMSQSERGQYSKNLLVNLRFLVWSRLASYTSCWKSFTWPSV